MAVNNILETLNVRTLGTAQRILVFAHGFGTDQSVWHKIIPYLTHNNRIILYDLVCSGSVNPDVFNFNHYASLDSYVQDLLTIMDILGVQKCIYIGHSMSGSIGILASLRRPALFTKLVLVNFSPWFLNDNEYHGGFEREDIEKVFIAMQTNYEDWVKGYAPLMVGGDLPTTIQEFSRTLFNMRPDISMAVCETMFYSDLRDKLGLVRVPCCIVQTTKDISVPVKVAEYLKTHLGGRNTTEIMHTDGHLPQLTAPMLMLGVLRRALRI